MDRTEESTVTVPAGHGAIIVPFDVVEYYARQKSFWHENERTVASAARRTLASAQNGILTETVTAIDALTGGRKTVTKAGHIISCEAIVRRDGVCLIGERGIGWTEVGPDGTVGVLVED